MVLAGIYCELEIMKVREVRIRRNPNGWYTVERVEIVDNKYIHVKPSYHQYILGAFKAARKWL